MPCRTIIGPNVPDDEHGAQHGTREKRQATCCESGRRDRPRATPPMRLHTSRRSGNMLAPGSVDGREVAMDAIVTELVQRFERGGLTRRELIQGLSALVATASATPAAAQAPGLQATGINHTSVLVADLQRTAELYGKIFGLKADSEEKANRILRLGTGGSGVASTLVSLRQQNPPGTIDHFAISVQGFGRDKVSELLQQHGLTPADNIEFGFHVKDPDGAVVQIV
jgi:catechol 2,3-dioxygenase-like lactoylglutathione lyase family enzyme